MKIAVPVSTEKCPPWCEANEGRLIQVAKLKMHPLIIFLVFPYRFLLLLRAYHLLKT